MHIQENHNKKYTEKKRKDEQKTKTWKWNWPKDYGYKSLLLKELWGTKQDTRRGEVPFPHLAQEMMHAPWGRDASAVRHKVPKVPASLMQRHLFYCFNEFKHKTLEPLIFYSKLQQHLTLLLS